MEKKIGRAAFYVAFLVVFTMWVVFFLDYYFNLDLYQFGIYPHTIKGLRGIIFSPFLHSTKDFGHILNNSAPTFVLLWLLFYHYRKIAMPTLISITLLTGIGVWLLARPSYHIGMSGVIYGLASFLVFSGFFRKNIRVAGISLLVIFMYGSIIWGIFPQAFNVSWEAHAMGLFSGIIMAVVFKKKGPQNTKYRYEIEEELGIEPEEEYWKEGYVPKVQQEQNMNPPKAVFRYEFIPKKVEIPNREEE